MNVEIIISNLIAVVVFILFTTWLHCQVLTSGEIVLQRRTHLDKRYEGSSRMGGRSQEWMKEPKIDEFVLYFNDTEALFNPILPEVGDEDREWSTMKNSTYQDLSEGKLERQFSYYGSEIY